MPSAVSRSLACLNWDMPVEYHRARASGARAARPIRAGAGSGLGASVAIGGVRRGTGAAASLFAIGQGAIGSVTGRIMNAARALAARLAGLKRPSALGMARAECGGRQALSERAPTWRHRAAMPASEA